MWVSVAKVLWVFFKCVAISVFRIVTREFQYGCKVISLCCYVVVVGLQIVLRDQKSKEGFKYQSVEIY